MSKLLVYSRSEEKSILNLNKDLNEDLNEDLNKDLNNVEELLNYYYNFSENFSYNDLDSSAKKVVTVLSNKFDSCQCAYHIADRISDLVINPIDSRTKEQFFCFFVLFFSLDLTYASTVSFLSDIRKYNRNNLYSNLNYNYLRFVAKNYDLKNTPASLFFIALRGVIKSNKK